MFKVILSSAFYCTAVGTVVAGGVATLAADVLLNSDKKAPPITQAYFFAVNSGWNFASGFTPSYSIKDAYRRSYGPIAA